MAKDDRTIEESFQALDQIVQQLEGGDASLEEAFSLYQKGMTLLKECNQKIETVEKKMIVLREDGQGSTEF